MGGFPMDRDVDFALALKVLYSRGYSLASMARTMGAPISTLSTVKQESKYPPAHWYTEYEGMALAEYYNKVTGEVIPRVGDHVDIEGEDYG